MDVETDQDISNVFVSTTTQGSDAMKNAIADNHINCAFLWPQCPETYSYVYYELLMSGVFMISNEESGNIRDEIRARRNGKTFKDINECLQWLSDPEKVLEEINAYRTHETIPEAYTTNPDISMMVSETGTQYKTDRRLRKCLLPFSSMMYKLKYMKYRI